VRVCCRAEKSAACHFAKMKHRSTEATVERKVESKDGSLKAGNLKPGRSVTTDQYVSYQLLHTKGKESESEKYCGGTIYVDEESGFMFVNHQVSLNAEEMIHGKHLFEREAMNCGHAVSSYRSDNRVYKSDAFVADLQERVQMIVYCSHM
jgi:hypothetical protein